MAYCLFSTNYDSEKIVTDFYQNILGPYWDSEWKYLDENYKMIPFPFDEILMETFEKQSKSFRFDL